MFTVYTNPGCGPCVFLKAHLREHQIPHTIIDVTQDPAAAERLRALGYTTTPVSVNEATGEHWAGYHPERYVLPEDTAAAGPDLAATIDLGPVDAGEHVLWDRREGNVLIIGERDSGKSALQGRIMRACQDAGWQAWGFGLPGELEQIPESANVQVLVADVADQLERIRAAQELMDERYHLMEIASLAQESIEPFQPVVLVIDDYASLRQRWADLSVEGEQQAHIGELMLLNLHRLGRSAGVHLSVSCHGIAHRLGQEMASSATVVHTSMWRSPLEKQMAHAG